MTPKKDQQQLAKDLYLHTDKTQQEIADILDVNRRTIYLWMKHGRWEEMKIAGRNAPYILTQNIYNYFDLIDIKIRRREPEERCPTPQEVNMMYKLLRMTNLINTQNTGAYMQAYEELIKYLSKTDLPLAQQVVKAADNYIRGFLDRGTFFLDNIEDANVAASIENLERMEKELQADLADEAAPVPDKDGQAEVPGQNTGVDSPAETASQDYVSSHDLPQCDNNGIMCDKDATIESVADIRPKPTLVKPHTENDKAPLSQNSTENIFSENACPPTSIEMPDNTVVVYPDLDEYNNGRKKMYEMRQQMEAEYKAENSEEAIARKVITDKFMNKDIYEAHRDLLKCRSADINDKVTINGKEVNLMWFQYNLSQMELPASKRELLTEQEFHRRHSIEATLRNMRRPD